MDAEENGKVEEKLDGPRRDSEGEGGRAYGARGVLDDVPCGITV